MKATEWFSQLGTSDFAGAMTAVRTEHGRGASRWLASRAGVSQRTAQRWMAGTQKPGKAAHQAVQQIRHGQQRRAAGERLRQITTVDVGEVAVDAGTGDDASPDGYRKPSGRLDIGSAMDLIAATYERGDDSEAERLFGVAVIAAYGGEEPTDDSGLASVLHITDYRDGIS